LHQQVEMQAYKIRRGKKLTHVYKYALISKIAKISLCRKAWWSSKFNWQITLYRKDYVI